MKKIIFLFLLITISKCFSQCNEYYCIYFDDTFCLNKIVIDTINFQNNIWQIGNDHKSETSSCQSKVITTDTVNPYPVNNHSVFTIANQATMADLYGFRIFTGRYFVQTDSLKDFGKIEFSANKGKTWIDIINDTAYSNNFVWFSGKPVLTGNSSLCRYFSVDLADQRSIFNFNLGDTLLYRFSFFSDSVFDHSAGLMFDELCFSEFVEGITKIVFIPLKSKVYPNPSEDIFTVEFDNPNADLFQLNIYDIHSKPILNREGITGNKVEIDAHTYKPGMYVYKITDSKALKRCWGRFMVSH